MAQQAEFSTVNTLGELPLLAAPAAPDAGQGDTTGDDTA